VIDEAVIIHLRAGGLHGVQITTVEIRPHRAAEEIDTPDADLFIKQQLEEIRKTRSEVNFPMAD
ncbi:MAG: hypothetical protein WCF22_10570, partial [Candidatus Sulfotelmatobacter sp.]